MSVLDDREIEQLKEINPKKKILKVIFLIVGFALIAVGIMLLLLAIDLGVTVSDLNISFAIDILLIVFGMIFASKYFTLAPYYLKENSLGFHRMRNLREPVDKYVKFNSFALSRLMAAGYFIAAGLWSFTVFGIGIGHNETRYGNAFVLGGPSFFYFTGLPALIIGICLLLYVGLSTFRGVFSESKNFYFFYELRPLSPWLTEIPKKDIEAIRYQNNHIGPKLAWIMLLLPFIVLQLQTGILLFSSERAAPEHVFSVTMTGISILEIIALIILVFFPQNYYEIATKDMLYEMWFSPIKLRNQVDLTKEIGDFLGCGIDKEKRDVTIKSNPKNPNETTQPNQPTFSELSNTNFQLFDLIFGLFLIISAVIMLTQMMLFGPWFWWVALMYGFMLLIKALCYDFSRRGADNFSFDESNKIFKFQRRIAYKFHYITAKKVESVKVRKWYRQLDFFDIFGLGGMLIMLTIQQIEGWAIADTTGLITDNIISTIYMIIVFIFIILFLCLPIDVIEFKTPSITYRIRVTTKLNDKTLIKKYISNLKSLPKECFKEDMKKTFLIRIGIVAALILGALTYTIYILLTYFP